MSKSAGSPLKFLERHATALQALAGLVTMVVAVLALAGVKLQIDASARLQQEQSARDIYREFLNLSISRPELANPDYCAIRSGSQRAAYENYVEYLLYTGDQLLAASPTWEATLTDHLKPHREYLCAESDWSDDTPQIRGLMTRFQASQCKGFVSACAD
ncbi:hypothetical protein [Novosphingobium sp.]|uniref:hypothetical protein n=1 Tax=Novosphingobium sp. TaxID=1874826 RepID=UPI00286D2990|nr:hypothetical protein [Novosphingobium sp.]